MHQLEIANKVVNVLGLVGAKTKSISTDAASVSFIIPFIRAFRLSLKKDDGGDRGVQTMKREMLASLNRCYKDVETHKELAIATLLDPQFKDKLFTDHDVRSKACKMLDECMVELTDEIETKQTQEPSPKRPRPTILNCFSEILAQSGVSMVDDAETAMTEVEKYLREPLIPFHQSNLFTWWKENKQCLYNCHNWLNDTFQPHQLQLPLRGYSQ